MIICMALAYLVEHGEKQPVPGNPGLTPATATSHPRWGIILAGRGTAAGIPRRPARHPRPVAVVTHGGITTDLLRNLLHDDALPPQLLGAGIPPCAITMIDDLIVVTIASAAHLS